MSTRISADTPQLAAVVKSRHALRIAGGLAVPIIVGEVLNWDLPFLGSIFALQLLAVRRPVPSFAQGLATVLALGAVVVAARILTAILLPSPVVFTLVIALVVYLAFFALARTASPVFFMALVAITVLPVLTTQSPEAVPELLVSLIASMACAVATVWLMHAMFPEPADLAAPPPFPAASPDAASRMASVYMLVVMPLLLLLIFRNSTFVIVMIATLSIIQASVTMHITRAAGGIVAANAVAGLVAGLAYYLINAAPNLPFLVAIVILLSLVFGTGIAMGGARAPLVVVTASATFILLGLGLTPFTDTSAAFASRVAGVILASIYCVGMLALLRPRSP